FSNRARTKLSIGFFGHSFCFTLGRGGRRGATNAQCCWYLAPVAIHCRNNSFCASVNVFFVEAGGILSSGSAAVIREINSLSFGLPGTIARFPDLAGCKAVSD